MKLRAIKRRAQRQQHDHKWLGRFTARMVVRMLQAAIDRAVARVVRKYYDDQRELIEHCIRAHEEITGNAPP